MNPPDYYSVPNAVLEAAEPACKKYLASSETIPEVVEIVIDLLMGRDWPECDVLDDLRHLSLFYKALYFLLPTTDEINREVLSGSDKYFGYACQYFKEYLNEPS